MDLIIDLFGHDQLIVLVLVCVTVIAGGIGLVRAEKRDPYRHND